MDTGGAAAQQDHQQAAAAPPVRLRLHTGSDLQQAYVSPAPQAPASGASDSATVHPREQITALLAAFQDAQPTDELAEALAYVYSSRVRQ